jgi:OmpA-OmpF porin, OOP family
MATTKPISLFLFVAACCCRQPAAAQGFLNRMADHAASAAEHSVNRRVERHIDEAVNTEAPKKTRRQETAGTGDAAAPAGNTPQRRTVTASRSYDFVAGAQTLFAEDFRQDVTGEFPLKWFTKSSGETAELQGIAGKWLRMVPDGRYASPMIRLKDNYTIEFDLVADIPNGNYPPAEFGFRLISNGDGRKAVTSDFREQTVSGFRLYPYRDKSQLTCSTEENGRDYFGSPVTGVTGWLEKSGQVTHVAIQVQQSRLRLWIDREKIIDAPDVIPAGAAFNQLLFTMSGTSYAAGEIGYYVSNIRLAAGAADTRSKLLTEGKVSTTGITFAVNSDAITPASAPTLAEIAGALKSAPDMNVRITGHTDSDGDEARNLELSKKRAAAVREALVSRYGIAPERLSTDGRGESAPVADNASPEGRAANRRVEFLRL